jgi:hypothetical protein
MRLLECNNDSKFSLTEDFGRGKIPKYAILSHTWGADIEEATHRDLIDITGKNKVRYEKIRFYGEQARHDGLQYFWVNTCCINKSNKNELAEAINSMFRWYYDAAKCYVFLSDVPRADIDTTDHSEQADGLREAGHFKSLLPRHLQPNECHGQKLVRLLAKKTWHTRCWAYSTPICHSSIAKGESTRSNGSGRRSRIL